MALLLAAAAQSSPDPGPDPIDPPPMGGTPASGTKCTIPLQPGEGSHIHPSVVDMVALTGATLGGWRWWMANTPMPEAYENPSIYVSNDRINWHVPAGLTNPIDPWPGEATNNTGWFNSDTELAWDADLERLIVWWREAGNGGPFWWHATSADGITWDHAPGDPFIASGGGANMSMGLDTDGNEWRAYLFGERGGVFTAPSSTGPWTSATHLLTGWMAGYHNDSPGMAYHGDVIYHPDGYWLVIANVRWTGTHAGISLDGYTWHWTTDPVVPGSYRPTMTPSPEAGQIDVWVSPSSIYYRLPLTTWTDLLP